MLSTGLLTDTSRVKFADRLSVGIKVEVKEDLKVGVQHEDGVIQVSIKGLPLPVRHIVFVSGILVNTIKVAYLTEVVEQLV